MNLNLTKLKYTFLAKPLLVGGKAMEYYGLRKSGKDIDLIAQEQDVINLIKMYPSKVKNVWADLGVCPYEFEIWRTIRYHTYEDLVNGVIEQEDHFVISKRNLLIQKALASQISEKYLKDTQLLIQSITNDLSNKYTQENHRVNEILSKIPNIKYLEHSGPK